jgi:hypothetical protein
MRDSLNIMGGSRLVVAQLASKLMTVDADSISAAT